MKKIVCVLLIVICCISCDRTHSYARKGNNLYNKKDYKQSADNYINALKEDSTFFDINYNLGNAFMQGKNIDYQKAIKAYDKYLSNKLDDNKDTLHYSQALYNKANACFGLYNTTKEDSLKQRYLQVATDNYKAALLLNPSDSNTKYNYSLCLWLMKNNNQQDKNNNNNNSSNSQINQMLQAMKNNEKMTISKVKKQKQKVQDSKNEKDW